jgi:Cytochrome c554 and c-prime
MQGMELRSWVTGRTGRFGLLAMLFAVTMLALAIVRVPATQAQADGGARFLGVASCAGSTCHGRMEGDGIVVRQDELMRWQEPSTPGGSHSRAFAVLSNSRSQFIARNLGIGDAANAAMCLGCHSSDAVGGAAYRNDGVGCESCHGPSGSWIASHYAGVGTSPDPDAEMRAKHLANLGAGLMKLEDPKVRARVCLDCHYGAAGEGQFVTHRIMAAGHPRIAFEMDLFSTLQQHHAEDRDYGVRKGAPDHMRMWAVGQAAALSRSLALFQSKRGTEGVFPEFTFYDCHSCHRRIFDAAKPVRTGVNNPGRAGLAEGMPPYNDENMIMLAAAARLADTGLAAELDARSKAFHAAMTEGRPNAVKAAAALAETSAKLENAFAARSFSTEDGFRLVDAIAGSAIAPRFTDYAGSVQAVMGIDTLLNAMVSSGRVTIGAAAGIRSDIDRAYGAVKDPNAYRPADFQASLGSAVRAIRALR